LRPHERLTLHGHFHAQAVELFQDATHGLRPLLRQVVRTTLLVEREHTIQVPPATCGSHLAQETHVRVGRAAQFLDRLHPRTRSACILQSDLHESLQSAVRCTSARLQAHALVHDQAQLPVQLQGRLGDVQPIEVQEGSAKAQLRLPDSLDQVLSALAKHGQRGLADLGLNLSHATALGGLRGDAQEGREGQDHEEGTHDGVLSLFGKRALGRESRGVRFTQETRTGPGMGPGNRFQQPATATPRGYSGAVESDPQRLELRVPKRQNGKRLDEVLAQLVPSRSRARLQKLVRRGAVSIDGRKVVRSNHRLSGGERLELRLSPDTGLEEATSARTAPPVLSVLHEDAELLAIDKPPGLLTHPARGHSGWSVSELAEARFGPLPDDAGVTRPGIVHRLDRETSGVLLVARTSASMATLRAHFRERRVEKTYLALVAGEPRRDAWEIDHPLGPAPDGGDRQWIEPPTGGRPARTRFTVRTRFDGATLLECHPESGRRHQVRLHICASDLTLVEDAMYRPREVSRLPAQAPRVGRHALHALRLALPHPLTGSRLQLTAPLPEDLEQLLTWLRTRASG